MAAIFQTTFSKAFSWKERFYVLIKIWLKFVAEDIIDIKSALVQIMAWCWTGDKPLFEPVIA